VIAKQQTLSEDGFHAVFTTAESRRAFVGVLMSMALGSLEHRRDVNIVACKEVRLPGSFSIATQIDGEPVMPSPRLLRLSDDRLTVIVPRQSPLATQTSQGA
jgi:diacylglycerol kinase family enzyme